MPLQFKAQQMAFESVKVDGEFAYGVDRQQKAAETENRACLVLRVVAGKERADMAEFIEIDNVMHVPSPLGDVQGPRPQKHESPQQWFACGLRKVGM
ncbi:hypothetical protein WJ978_06095 [Achromobacter xylosoxidans]